MFIQFTVENFRSIKTSQTLSLIASGSESELTENIIEPQAGFKKSLLRQAAIYGPNAAGKSTLLLALEAFKSIVKISAILRDQRSLPIAPYALDAETVLQPTVFTLTFLVEGIRYQYEVAATEERIWHEELTAWPQGMPQVWFARTAPKEDKETWQIRSGLKGTKQQKEVWKASTRPDSLFLSIAVQLNNSQLKPIFDWITEKLIIVTTGTPNYFPSFHQLDSAIGKERIMTFLSAADVGIDDVMVQERDNIQAGRGAVHRLSIGSQPRKIRSQTLYSIHKINNTESLAFDFSEESDGTRKLLELAGNWLNALENGATLLVDEIDRSLHPHLVQMLVKLFGKQTNPHNAQLIFTTHDTTLLDAKLLRRDQIWFVEKQDSATQVFSLLEFSPRKTEALERGYLLGRYGAIPFIDEFRLKNG